MSQHKALQINARCDSSPGEITHEAFYAEIRKQCKTNWRRDFTAPVINDWMRKGFGMKEETLKHE